MILTRHRHELMVGGRILLDFGGVRIKLLGSLFCVFWLELLKNFGLCCYVLNFVIVDTCFE